MPPMVHHFIFLPTLMQHYWDQRNYVMSGTNTQLPDTLDNLADLAE